MSSQRCKLKVLKKYPQAVIHLRRAWKDNRFGLVLGSGFSKGFNLPDWDDLIKRIFSHEDVQGGELSVGFEGSQTSKSQQLFHHYKERTYKKGFCMSKHPARLDREAKRSWHDIIRQELYKDSPKSPKKLLSMHPYLKQYLRLIQEAHLTVNYNFDDCIERIILSKREPTDHARGYEVVWDGRLEYSRTKCIIYHPNGFLPHEIAEHGSEELVFAEDSFADQLNFMIAGHYASLFHHFSKTTCLLIGLSLEDSGLKHLLHQGALLNPGHIHYHIRYKEKGVRLKSEFKNSVSLGNFDTYNLVTMFLNKSEIKALGELILENDDQFECLCREIGVPRSFVYYITGSIGVGKTTAVRHLKSFRVFDEWLDLKHPLLDKQPPTDLSSTEEKEVDDWILNQVKKKNDHVAIRTKEEGVYIIDRTPLDAFTFTKEDKMRKKASMLWKTMTSGEEPHKIVSGHVILLIGDEDEVADRNASKRGNVTKETIIKMQRKFKCVFPADMEGVTIVNVRGLGIRNVTKLIAKTAWNSDFST